MLITCRYEIAARDAQAATENSVSVFLLALKRSVLVSPFRGGGCRLIRSSVIVCAQDEDDGEDVSDDDDDETEQALPYIP